MKKLTFTLGSVAAAVLLGAGLWAVRAVNTASSFSTVIRGADHFELIYRVKLPDLIGTGSLWLPLAKSDVFQTVEVEGISAPTAWKQIQDRDFKNQILVLAPGPADSGKEIEIKYRVTRLEKGIYAGAGENPMRHLKPERLVPVNETFQTISRELTSGKATAFARGRAIYDHVLERMKYDKSGQGWGRGDALYACDARTGNCTDFHAYFIALARAAAIPARFAIGMTIPADKDEGEIAGYHCWAEFLADGQWIPVDISEASRFPELANYYFGHHPANRFELSVGRDLIVDPAPASSPINFLIYPLLEVDGQIVKAETQFSFRRVRE
jgi:hypothetical protein